MPEDFEKLESRLIERFNNLPEDEKVRFFVTLSSFLLDEDQIRSMIKILQERLP